MDDQDRADRKALGRAMAARRAELGLSRKDLAERAGLSYPFIANLESGAKQPSTKALHALANALELRPADLLHRADELAHLIVAGDAPTEVHARSPRPSWFRDAQGVIAPAPQVASRRATGDDGAEPTRALVRQIVREELGSRTASTTPIRSVPDGVPAWLDEPTTSPVDQAVREAAIAAIHDLGPEASPEEAARAIDRTLKELAQVAERRRRDQRERRP